MGFAGAASAYARTCFGSAPIVGTVWTDGSGRHSSNPHFRRCGVGYVTVTGERVWLPLPGCQQSVYRAVVRALEDCSLCRVVSVCKGVLNGPLKPSCTG
eukprot:6465140-Amphidinium_carterae.2